MLFQPGKIAAASRLCWERGVALVVVGFPATPLMSARARVCISAAHTRADLERALQVPHCMGLPTVASHHLRVDRVIAVAVPGCLHVHRTSCVRVGTAVCCSQDCISSQAKCGGSERCARGAQVLDEVSDLALLKYQPGQGLQLNGAEHLVKG